MDAVTEHCSIVGLLAAGAATAKGKGKGKDVGIRMAKSIGIPNSNSKSQSQSSWLRYSSGFQTPLPLLRSIPPFSSVSASATPPPHPHPHPQPQPQADDWIFVSPVQTQSQSKTVHVKFVLRKKCLFGEQFHLVGDDQTFGLWNPSNAIPLEWSDGHVWKAELDIPAGKSIQYKFILRGLLGEVRWQPGPDRIIQTWQTAKTIVVSEDWENAENQKVTEEELLAEAVISSENCDPATNVPNVAFVVGDDTQQDISDEKLPQSLDYKENLSSSEGSRLLVPGFGIPVSNSASVFPQGVNGNAADVYLASDVAKDCNSSQFITIPGLSMQLSYVSSKKKKSFLNTDYFNLISGPFFLSCMNAGVSYLGNKLKLSLLLKKMMKTIQASSENLIVEEPIMLSEKLISSDSDATVSCYGMQTENKAHQKEPDSESVAGVPGYQVEIESSLGKDVENEASSENLLAEETKSEKLVSSDYDATVSYYSTQTEDKAHQQESDSESAAGVLRNDVQWDLKAFNQLLSNLGFRMNPPAL